MSLKSEKIQELLEAHDLSPYQAEAYVTLLELRDASVSAIVNACSVPQPRMYDVLRDLDEMGYLQTYEEDTLRARVNDPERLVTDLKDHSERLVDVAETIEDMWEQPPISEYRIEAFRDFKHVINNAQEAIERARESVHIALSKSHFIRLQTSLKQAKQRGVIIKMSLYLDDTEADDVSEYLSYFQDTATEVRIRETPAPFLGLIDVNKSYIGLDRSVNSYGMFVQDQALSAILYNYFTDSLWGRWDTVYIAPEESFPREYVDLRNCVSDVSELLSSHTIWAVLTGIETVTGHSITVEGEIKAIRPDPETNPNVHIADQVSLEIQTEDGLVTVGGFGAILEDIKAKHIRIELRDR